MTLALGCIADDHTGASDLANTLTRCGQRTVQTIGIPADDLQLPDVDAVVVSLKSRSIAASRAVEKSRAAEKWMRARRGSCAVQDLFTFDSTDAGNIGPVMDALADRSRRQYRAGDAGIPRDRSDGLSGNLFVGSVPVNESPLKDHPLHPMHHPISSVRGAAGATNIGAGRSRSCRLRRRRGADPSRWTVGEWLRRGDHRRGVRQRSGNHRCRRPGSSRLGRCIRQGLGLARALVASGRVKANAATSIKDTPVGGAAACLAGSCSQATLQ